jgi:hypothetical protein
MRCACRSVKHLTAILSVLATIQSKNSASRVKDGAGALDKGNPTSFEAARAETRRFG